MGLQIALMIFKILPIVPYQLSFMKCDIPWGHDCQYQCKVQNQLKAHLSVRIEPILRLVTYQTWQTAAAGADSSKQSRKVPVRHDSCCLLLLYHLSYVARSLRLFSNASSGAALGPWGMDESLTSHVAAATGQWSQSHLRHSHTRRRCLLFPRITVTDSRSRSAFPWADQDWLRGGGCIIWSNRLHKRTQKIVVESLY